MEGIRVYTFVEIGAYHLLPHPILQAITYNVNDRDLSTQSILQVISVVAIPCAFAALEFSESFVHTPLPNFAMQILIHMLVYM